MVDLIYDYSKSNTSASNLIGVTSTYYLSLSYIGIRQVNYSYSLNITIYNSALQITIAGIRLTPFIITV